MARRQCAKRSQRWLALVALLLGAVGMAACNLVVGADDFTLEGACRNAEDVRCNNNTPQTCNAGQWQDVPEGACVDRTCKAGACTGSCAPGKRCAGSAPQTCDADGEWKSAGPACAAPTHCQGGVCVVACTPGDLRCDGDQPQRCGEEGTWQDHGATCDPCHGCDAGTGACSASPKMDGDSCVDVDPCTLTAECKSGQCVALTTVECVGACSAAVCDPSTGACASADGTTCDDGDVCAGPSTCQGGVCVSDPPTDRAWAHWDLESPPPSPRYVPTSAVVYDAQTHLTWQRRVPPAIYTWEEAGKYCQCLNGVASGVSCDEDKIPGYPSGWRLPARIELASLVDYQQSPRIDGVAFPGTPGLSYWTSSPYAADADAAWAVEFTFGFVGTNPKDSLFAVRCVR